VSALVNAAGVLFVVDRPAGFTGVVISRLRRSVVPVVLVAPLRLPLLRRVEALGDLFAAVVWAEELAYRLPVVLQEVSEGDATREAKLRIMTRAGDSSVVRRMVAEIFGGSVPPTSVRALADRVCMRPSTLYYHWAQSPLGSTSMKELLDWVRLMRAYEVRSRGRWSWASVCHHMEIDRRTLERTARRRCARALAQIEPADIEHSFRTWLHDGVPDTETPDAEYGLACSGAR